MRTAIEDAAVLAAFRAGKDTQDIARETSTRESAVYDALHRALRALQADSRATKEAILDAPDPRTTVVRRADGSEFRAWKPTQARPYISTTAALMGDPTPGRSALDERRRAGR